MNFQKWIRSALNLALTLTAITSMGVVTAGESEFDATIPVLDMDEYFDPDTRGKFVRELYDALKDVGFFAIINTGVDPDILDNAYSSCFCFFAQSQEEKNRAFSIAVSGQRGYVPGESAKGSSYGDFKEFYRIGREVSPEQARALNTWQNIWPDNFNLKVPMNRLYSALEEYMVPLEMAMAEAIGTPPDFFTEMTAEGDVLLSAIHYPSSPPKSRLWAAEHTDIDLFTILPRATAEGLQVMNRQGEWIDIRVPDKAFIINGGDMLENMTNGELRSGLHRVIAKADGYERYSIVFFVHPRSHDRMDPLPACIERTGGVRRYARATRLELLQERLVDLGTASPAMMRDLAYSGFMERQIEVGRASVKAMLKLKEVGLASDAVLAELDRLEKTQ